MKSPEEDGGGKRGRGELAAGHGGSEGVAAGPLGCNLRLGGSQVELSCSRLTEKQQTSHVGLDDGLFMVYVSAEASAQTPISCLARGPSVVSEARSHAVSQDAPRCSSNDLTPDY